MQLHVNREAYLEQAVLECRPFFDLYASPLPKTIKVSCGLPSTAKRTGAIGECHSNNVLGERVVEIFVSPVLDKPIEVIEVLIHELCHALTNSKKHAMGFQKYADALGLVPLGSGKNAYKNTKGGANFLGMWNAVIESLGDYPHTKIDLVAHKTQGTRMLQAKCPTCDYSIRTTRKWVDLGLPVCSIDGDTFILA